MNARNHELLFFEFLCNFGNSFFPVGEDHTLSDSHVFVELDQSWELLSIFFHRDIKLLDTVKCKLFIFHQNLDWIFHELLSHLKNFGWNSS